MNCTHARPCASSRHNKQHATQAAWFGGLVLHHIMGFALGCPTLPLSCQLGGHHGRRRAAVGCTWLGGDDLDLGLGLGLGLGL